MTSTPGAARDLPPLTGFEDDGDEPDMGALLKRKAPPADTHATPPASDAPGGGSVAAGSPEPAPARKRTKKATAGTAAASKTTDREATAATGKPRAERAPRRPAHSERSNKIRSTSVHVPAPLLESLVAYREAQDLSNGDIVIAAIEHAHPRLRELITPPSRAGGSLFEGRTARSARTTDGHLTPLNVRLFENDFDVLDDLVAQFGARSRGHLITAALTDFFASH